MEYLKGIDFDAQSVTPKNKGKLQSKMLGDCILNGCAVTFSGTNVYIAAGQLLIEGRQIEIASSITLVTNTPNANGYGRVKIVIDLTETSSSTVNHQAKAEIDYSATEDFTALTKNDINVSGTKYECEFAIITFEASTISAVTASLHEATSLNTAIELKQDKVANVSDTEIGYLNGVTSAIQPQLNSKQKAITSGTSAPSGGSDGDIYLQYT